MICEDCEMDGEDTPATVTWRDPWGRIYATLCERCADSRIDHHSGVEQEGFRGGEAAAYAAEQQAKAQRLK